MTFPSINYLFMFKHELFNSHTQHGLIHESHNDALACSAHEKSQRSAKKMKTELDN